MSETPSISHIAPYPLLWPEGTPRTITRQGSLFKVSIETASRELTREMKAFAQSFVVTCNVTGIDVRFIGRDPGVAVWFVRRKAVRCIAVDEYQTVRENLRAVGLCVAALRAMERHSMQLVDSFLQPTNAPQLPQVAGEGRSTWWQILGLREDASPAVVEAAYKELAKKHHPDKGGTRSDWDDLQRAVAEARSR